MTTSDIYSNLAKGITPCLWDFSRPLPVWASVPFCALWLCGSAHWAPLIPGFSAGLIALWPIWTHFLALLPGDSLVFGLWLCALQLCRKGAPASPSSGEPNPAWPMACSVSSGYVSVRGCDQCCISFVYWSQRMRKCKCYSELFNKIKKFRSVFIHSLIHWSIHCSRHWEHWGRNDRHSLSSQSWINGKGESLRQLFVYVIYLSIRYIVDMVNWTFRQEWCNKDGVSLTALLLDLTQWFSYWGDFVSPSAPEAFGSLETLGMLYSGQCYTMVKSWEWCYVYYSIHTIYVCI